MSGAAALAAGPLAQEPARLAELRGMLGDPFDSPEGREPYPIGAWPNPFTRYITEAADAIGVPPEMVGCPMLGVLSGLVGNSRVVEAKAGHAEPMVLWCATVAPSGTGKSPALRAATCFARSVERDLRHGWLAELEAWRVAKAEAEARGEKVGPAPPEPRVLAGDATLEALAVRLSANPRGLILAHDELAGLIKGLDAYRGGRGADAQRLLSSFGAEHWRVDRKGEAGSCFVPRAALSIVGGVQPAIWSRCVAGEHTESGLVARFLVCWPDARPVRHTEAEIPARLTEAVQAVVDRLAGAELRMRDGEPDPIRARLGEDARRAFIMFNNRCADAQHGRSEGERAVLSKIGGSIVLRVAGVLHAVRCASGELPFGSDCEVDGPSMFGAIELAQWHGREALRLLAWAGSSEVERERAELEAFARERGLLSTREAMRRFPRYRTAADAERAIGGLVDAGLAVWADPPIGRPGPVARCVRWCG